MVTLEQLAALQLGDAVYISANQPNVRGGRWFFKSYQHTQGFEPTITLRHPSYSGLHTLIVTYSLLHDIERIVPVAKQRKFARRGRNYQFLLAYAKPMGFEHETNDCTVRALACCTGIPYSEAHAHCKAKGRKDGRGMFAHALYPSWNNGTHAFKEWTWKDTHAAKN